MHINPMPVSAGEFNEWQASSRPCRYCGGAVKYRVWESSCGGHEDEQHRCQNTACGRAWWVDGSDS